MKLNKLRQELSALSQQELADRLESYRREYFGLKLNATTTHLKDYSQFAKLRKNIARISTLITASRLKAQ